MSQVYISGRWTVVPGREEEFVTARNELAEWTWAEIPGSSWATLLQHLENPNVFLSFGPCESPEAVAASHRVFKSGSDASASSSKASSLEYSTAAPK